MLGLVLTLDYEIYGTGKGDFDSLMVAPTDRLLDLCDKYHAKLTIMAEVAEIMALRNSPAFHPVVERIDNQLVRAIARGHDVQLHLHPAWFNAWHDGSRWILDFDEYALVGLPLEKIEAYIRQGKEYLENLIQNTPAGRHYKCIAFRAGNWLMQPSRDIIRALESNDIQIDTSVYKWGVGRAGRYVIDYREAHSNIFPWVVDEADINTKAERQGLKEIPIMTRKVFIASMLTPRRLRLQRELRRGSRHDASESGAELGGGKKMGGLSLFHAKKLDFCRLTFREMRSFLSYAQRACESEKTLVPIVAIGHSGELADIRDLEKFFAYVNELDPEKVGWATFGQLSQ